MTFAEHVNKFNANLTYDGKLIKHVSIMNPFRENPEVLSISEKFYDKYYGDQSQRKFILGINPGRLGAGATGIPFTDTKRLSAVCGIASESMQTHEPSSVFIYEMIEEYGGAEKFYADYYINSVCPLGFIRLNEKGNWINCNYYDYNELFRTVKDFMIETLKQQIEFGIDRSVCFVLGKKNLDYFKKINDEEKLFERLVMLYHPRYIMQYKSKEKQKFLDDYLIKLKS